MLSSFGTTFKSKLIYIFRINDKAHKGFLKIGDAALEVFGNPNEVLPNSVELKQAAWDRIDSYTSTAGISYELLHCEIAITENGKAFRDYDVHEVLMRSGISKKYFDTNRKQNDWFKVELQTAIHAVQTVKKGKYSIPGSKIAQTAKSPIIFRDEQTDAIRKTVSHFKTSNSMLWNAKMRFGKTLSSLEVIKQMGFSKTIIVTHRPVVSDAWFDDFSKIFYETDTKYVFGSKITGEPISSLIKNASHFVYFASMQDLRGSVAVGGSFQKNELVLGTYWDCVIIDEAHEGTKTELGREVLHALIKEDSDCPAKTLRLSVVSRMLV